jgi:sugar O-acyltransferase (sialic acid O-acetyltransferase NeuD family)
MKPELILVGGGGHCKSCIDVIEEDGKYKIAGIVDLPPKLGEKILGYEVIGCDHDLPELRKKFSNFLITLGQIKTPNIRIQIFERIKNLNGTLCVIISPYAHVSQHAQLGEGTIVMHGCIINAAARVGHNCIINTKALVEHDAVIGDHCHISTASVVNGNTFVDTGTFFGSNSVTRESIRIGENSMIGCGLRINHSLPKQSIKTK